MQGLVIELSKDTFRTTALLAQPLCFCHGGRNRFLQAWITAKSKEEIVPFGFLAPVHQLIATEERIAP